MLFAIPILLSGCKHAAEGDGDDSNVSNTITPVTITRISHEAIASYITLNASSSFLKKSVLKSPSNGYIHEIKVSIGDHVKNGQVLFSLQTKEAAAYKDVPVKDSLFNFPGLILVRAGSDGIAVSIPHGKGDYAQEGDELCTLAEQSSLVFLLEVPYEFHPFIHPGEDCIIDLPDGKNIHGRVESQLSAMDVSAQTQRYIISPKSFENIPENLVASISIVKSKKDPAQTLPKDAVLSDETQSEFWVMKLESDSVAVRIPVHLGIQHRDRVEITDPEFNTTDRFVLSGNYGLPDRARILITGQTP